MPYSTIASRVSFGTTGGTFATQAQAALTTIYEGSPLAAAAIDSWLVANPTKDLQILFKAGDAAGVINAGIVYIDPAFFNQLYYISKTGKAVADSFVSGLTHELGHAVGGAFDNDRWNHLAGDNVDLVNPWFVQLGFEQQVSYNASVQNSNLLDLNYDYTGGAVIANAMVDQGMWPSGDQVVTFNTTVADLSALGVTGSTLVVGSSAANDYKGTASDDWLYGQGGADKLDGKAGDDHLYGGDDSDELRGGDGNDTLEGGSGADTLFGDANDDVLFGFKDPSQSGGNQDDGAKDHLNGGDGSDALYGFGSDELNGGNDDDYLEIENANGATLTGGAGNDSFTVKTSSGFSSVTLTILDSDEMDSLNVDGRYLFGGTGDSAPQTLPTEVVDRRGNIFINDTATSTLTIQLRNEAGTITVNDFQDGDLGIHFTRVAGRPSLSDEKQMFSYDSDSYKVEDHSHLWSATHVESLFLA